MKGVAILLLAVALAPLTSRTNSDAATRKGTKQFAAKDFAAAARSFAEAARLRPSPESSFNLGTALVAAGDLPGGSRALEGVMRDGTLRANALYNRGTGALLAGNFESAVRDLGAALREAPANPAAKRNLEIALRRQDAQRRTQAGEGQRRQGDARDQQKGDKPAGQQDAPKPGEADPQAILRSVQQQELEELSRMRQPRGETRVGW
ncbi:MAG: hypothetical protein WA208_08905 [Thermoanaerobaculia bacterium]